jgi:hypothetical protein
MSTVSSPPYLLLRLQMHKDPSRLPPAGGSRVGASSLSNLTATAPGSKPVRPLPGAKNLDAASLKQAIAAVPTAVSKVPPTTASQPVLAPLNAAPMPPPAAAPSAAAAVVAAPGSVAPLSAAKGKASAVPPMDTTAPAATAAGATTTSAISARTVQLSTTASLIPPSPSASTAPLISPTSGLARLPPPPIPTIPLKHVLAFCFPSHQLHPRSTARLYALSAFGPPVLRHSVAAQCLCAHCIEECKRRRKTDGMCVYAFLTVTCDGLD